MKKRFLKILLLASLCAVQLFALTARADAIDLFAGTTGSTSVPNMLLVLDNAANFSSSASGQTCIIDGVATALSGTVGGMEQCALYAVISSLPVTGTAALNIGVMVYNGPGVVDFNKAACVGSAGGCLVYRLTGLTSTTRPALLAWIRSWETKESPIKGNNQATGATMQEAWAYFAGRTGLSTRNYASIAPAAGCLKNFVVFVGNSYGSAGSPGDSTGNAGPKNALEGSNSTALMNASPAATTMQRAIITNTSANSATSCGTVSFPSNHENSGFYADEWARYMLGTNITTTYTVGVLGPSCQASYAWLLNSMATAGGGKYFPTTDYTALKTAFETILSEVQSVNSVFASVSLPVSVNTQGTYLNQVFVGMFRPDADSLPRWAGNLKQYKMGFLNGVFRLLDADGAAAVSSGGSEFIAECARSFWTPGLLQPDSYWNLFPAPNCTGYPASSNTPDGNMVEKGGQGYMLRSASPSARTVKTCSPVFSSCITLTDFNTSNSAITQAQLDGTNAVPRNTLINWARGANIKSPNDEVASVALTAMRPSAHGDVLHSRPVAINFGTDAAPRVVVFYGGNDGILRAINGNRPDKTPSAISVGTASVAAGAEFWAFMPPEFYDSIKRLYDNTAKISSPNIVGTPKSYGMDGSVTGYRDTNGDAWIYATMRRGGRALYAFKVDGASLAITLKWKRGCDSSGCTNDANGDFTGIGQTWATPKIIKAGYSASTPLLVMGGGYDAACEGAVSYTCGSTTGNRVYVMDADTGVLLRTFNTDRGVIGDVTFVRDASGLVSYGYAADLGGNVYRISGSTANLSIGSTPPASWTLTKIASLGCSTATTCTSPPNRKFMFGPDVVVEGSTHILLLGSGDREKPLNTSNTTSNYFFMIQDQATVATYLSDESSRCSGVSVLCLNSLLPITVGATPTASDLAGKKGWYLALNANEQVVTSAITVFGVVYFSTHQPTVPNPNSCSANLGTTRPYQIAYTNAGNPDGTSNPPYTVLTGVGLPPSPVAGKVTLDDGTTVPFIIGTKGSFGTENPVSSAGSSNPSKIRSYWYIQK